MGKIARFSFHSAGLMKFRCGLVLTKAIREVTAKKQDYSFFVVLYHKALDILHISQTETAIVSIKC